jgi:hypothetical protein
MKTLSKLILLVGVTAGFKPPGHHGKDYKFEEEVDLLVDKLRSHKTAMTFDWDKLNFCPSTREERPKHPKTKHFKSSYTYDVGLQKNMH